MIAAEPVLIDDDPQELLQTVRDLAARPPSEEREQLLALLIAVLGLSGVILLLPDLEYTRGTLH